MADQAALIATLSVQMAKFEAQMKEAVALADKTSKQIEEQFAKANPTMDVAKGTFFGNLAAEGAKKLLGFLEEIPGKLQAISKAAEVAGISLADAFKVTAAVGDLDIAARLIEDIGLQVERARQGDKNVPLLKLLDENGIKMALDANQAIRQLAGLMENASAAQAKLAAQTGAFRAEAIPALQKGAKHLDDMAGSARDAASYFETLIGYFKGLSAAAEIFGYTLVSWILRAGAFMDRFLADAYDGLAKIKVPFTNITAFPGAENAAKELRSTAQIADDAAQGFKLMADKANETLKALQQFGPAIPPELKKKGIKIPVATPAAGGDPRSALEREEDRINKRILLLNAETDSIGKNTFERERNRAAAELQAAIMKDGTELTKEQKAAVDALASRYAAAADEQDRVNKRFQAGVQVMQTVGSALGNAFADAVLEGKKLNDVLQSLIKTLARAAINAAFGTLFGGQPGGLGNALGLLLKGKQAGGPVGGGNPYVVGEKGPELFIPNTSGMIVPNHQLTSGVTVNPIYNIDASGADPAAIQRLEAALIATNATMEDRVRRTIGQDSRRRL